MNWKLIVIFTEFPESHGKRVFSPNVIGHRGHFIMGLQDGFPLSVTCACMHSESPNTMLCPWWNFFLIQIHRRVLTGIPAPCPRFTHFSHTLRSTMKQHIRDLTMFVLEGRNVWFGPFALVLPLRLTERLPRSCPVLIFPHLRKLIVCNYKDIPIKS